MKKLIVLVIIGAIGYFSQSSPTVIKRTIPVTTTKDSGVEVNTFAATPETTEVVEPTPADTPVVNEPAVDAPTDTTTPANDSPDTPAPTEPPLATTTITQTN